MSTRIWMVRAGEGGRLAEKFAEGYVAVGWNEFGDMTNITEKEEIRKLHDKVYPDAKKGAIPTSVAMFHRFRSILALGDKVVTYDVSKREHLVGTIAGDYEYKPNVVGDCACIRKVDLRKKARSDLKRTSTVKTLINTATLCSEPLHFGE